MVNHNKYYNFDTTRLSVFEYIKSWYNIKRIHSSLNYLTPEAVHSAAPMEQKN